MWQVLEASKIFIIATEPQNLHGCNIPSLQLQVYNISSSSSNWMFTFDCVNNGCSVLSSCSWKNIVKGCRCCTERRRKLNVLLISEDEWRTQYQVRFWSRLGSGELLFVEGHFDTKVREWSIVLGTGRQFPHRLLHFCGRNTLGRELEFSLRSNWWKWERCRSWLVRVAKRWGKGFSSTGVSKADVFAL